MNDFENIYHQTSPPLPPSAIHHHPAKYNNWSEEFTDYHSPPHQQHYSRTASASDVSEEEQLAFEKIFNEVNDQRDWDKEFADHESWEQNYNQQQQSVPVLVPQPNQPTVMSSNIPIIRNQPLFRSSSDMLDKKDWSQEFSKYHDLTADEMQPAQSVENEDWIQQYQKSMENRDKQMNEQEWNGLEKEWNRLKPEGKTYGYRAIHPEYQKYNYMASNPYLLRPAAIDGVIHTSLADSILALEAKTQLNPDDAKTWEQLGLKQQENEQDAAAITALEKAVSLDPTCMDAWMALAVSYTNEHCRMDAFNCLEQWIHNSDTYKQILDGEMLGKNHSDQEKRHAYITDLFLKAARFAPGEEMDADVQVGLGVLFHMSEEYEKAIDCFKAALISRPQDYQLWNKVGATLANSRDSHGAIEMYFNALQINPSFVRARYNLAISCMHLGQYRESAEHLLNALALQRTAAFSAGEAARMEGDNSPIGIPNDTSDGIWDSLRLLMYM
jgi:peroxin-5